MKPYLRMLLNLLHTAADIETQMDVKVHEFSLREQQQVLFLPVLPPPEPLMHDSETFVLLDFK